MFDFNTNTQTAVVSALAGATLLASQDAKAGTVIVDLPGGDDQSTSTSTVALYVYLFASPVPDATSITVAFDSAEGNTFVGLFAAEGSPTVTAAVEVLALVDDNSVLLESFVIDDSDDGVLSRTPFNGRTYNFDTGLLEGFAFMVDPDFGTGSGTAFAVVDNGVGGQQQLIVTTVPEPSSFVLLGLGGLLVARRRRDP